MERGQGVGGGGQIMGGLYGGRAGLSDRRGPSACKGQGWAGGFTCCCSSPVQWISIFPVFVCVSRVSVLSRVHRVCLSVFIFLPCQFVISFKFSFPYRGAYSTLILKNKSHSCAKEHGNKAEQDVEQMENNKSLYIIKCWYERTSAFFVPLPLDQFVTPVRCTCFHAHWHMDDPARWTDWDYETQHVLELEEADPLKDHWQSSKIEFIFHSYETETISHLFSSIFFFMCCMSCFSHFGNTKIYLFRGGWRAFLLEWWNYCISHRFNYLLFRC